MTDQQLNLLDSSFRRVNVEEKANLLFFFFVRNLEY